jgi:hypothetical protein
MNQYYGKMSECATYRDINGINEIYQNLVMDRMRMDKFFSMYLDKVGDKMDPEFTDTPVWKLYRKKLKEYGEVEQAIKVAQYYLKKSYV